MKFEGDFGKPFVESTCTSDNTFTDLPADAVCVTGNCEFQQI